jgi:hypothetical protein
MSDDEVNVEIPPQVQAIATRSIDTLFESEEDLRRVGEREESAEIERGSCIPLSDSVLERSQDLV